MKKPVIHPSAFVADNATVRGSVTLGANSSVFFGAVLRGDLLPEGAAWEAQIRSVAMILTGGGWRLCSGALVNNVRNDYTPYFLTANHCLGGEETWVIMFNYQSSSCANFSGNPLRVSNWMKTAWQGLYPRI